MYIFFNSFQTQVDFTLSNIKGFREQYLQKNSFPVQIGYYSDAGYRFKKHILKTNDNIFFGGSKNSSFYGLETYNKDTFIVAEDKQKDSKVMADIYFRISVD